MWDISVVDRGALRNLKGGLNFRATGLRDLQEDSSMFENITNGWCAAKGSGAAGAQLECCG